MPLSPTISPATFPQGNPNNNFSNVGGHIAGQPVMLTLYDLAPWNVLRTVYQRHGDMRPSFRMIIKAMGGPFTRGVAAPTTGHYEQDWNRSLVTIGSIVSGGGVGANMVVALDAGDMFNTAVTVGGVARQASYPQPNQTLQLPDGNMAIIVSKDVTTNPHRLTIRPVNAAVNLSTSVFAAEKYFINSNAWGEATALPMGTMSRIYKYTNTFQIIKASFGASGSAMTVDLYPQIAEGGDGNIYYKLKRDAIERFEYACSGALLWGQQMNNVTTTDTALGYDVAVSGTEGMIPFILANGYIDTYTPGSYTLQELYQIGRIFEQERSGTNQIVSWDGYDLYVEREQALAQFFSQTLAPQMISTFVNQSDPALLSDGWQPQNDQDFVAWLGFKAVHVGGYNFYFRLLHEFNEAIGAGAPAYDYSKWGIYMPLGQTRDKNTDQPRSYFGYEWRQLGNYKREAIIANIAGVGVAGINGFFPTEFAASAYDFTQAGMLSEIAAHMAGGNRFVIQRPA
jgi:hypothetical protein